MHPEFLVVVLIAVNIPGFEYSFQDSGVGVDAGGEFQNDLGRDFDPWLVGLVNRENDDFERFGRLVFTARDERLVSSVREKRYVCHVYLCEELWTR
jgi:hypothetical protein